MGEDQCRVGLLRPDLLACGPDRQEGPEPSRQGVTAFERTLAIAGKRLRENKFIIGPDFTLADIQFGHVLYRYYDIEIERVKLPAIRRYYEDLRVT